MTNRINAVIVALFAAMCGIAILSYSHQLTDPYILPKWCFTIGAGCLWLTVWTIAKLCTNRSCASLLYFVYWKLFMALLNGKGGLQQE